MDRGLYRCSLEEVLSRRGSPRVWLPSPQNGDEMKSRGPGLQVSGLSPLRLNTKPTSLSPFPALAMVARPGLDVFQYLQASQQNNKAVLDYVFGRPGCEQRGVGVRGKGD